jgi:predicted cupin superfamily sugar epimerase
VRGAIAPRRLELQFHLPDGVELHPCIVACFVAPGFDFVDFAMMSGDARLREWMREHHSALASLI